MTTSSPRSSTSLVSSSVEASDDEEAEMTDETEEEGGRPIVRSHHQSATRRKRGTHDSDEEEWRPQIGSNDQSLNDGHIIPSPTTREAFIHQIKQATSRITMPHQGASPSAKRLVPLPKGLAPSVTLRDFQETGYQWMVGLQVARLNGILADEMGTGKTLQVITFLLHLKQSQSHRKLHQPFALVVVPLSILTNWLEEVEKFTLPHAIQFLKYAGSKDERAQLRSEIDHQGGGVDVILTTYETANQDITYLQHLSFTTLIVDEAHRIKNRDSLLHQNLLTIQAPVKVLMTGTPVQNNIIELKSLLHFLNPNLFDHIPDQTFLSWFDPPNIPLHERMALVKDLDSVVQPFILRREKKNVLTLPEMREIVLYVPMTNLQKKLYKSLLIKDLSVFDRKQRTGLLNLLMQLRKCALHPYLFAGVEPEPFEAGEHLITASGKLLMLDCILKILKRRGRKALVFSQLTSMLDIVQDYLEYREYTYERLDGSIRGEERNAAVKAFQSTSDDAFVFLLSTRAGGVGLNLTAADVVIFLDTDFNPQQDQQAMARAHRIGQTSAVVVFRILCQFSVEELIYKRSQRKLLLAKELLQHQDPTSAAPTDPEDMISMLHFGLDKLLAVEGGGDGEGEGTASAAPTEEEIEAYLDEAECSTAVQTTLLATATELEKEKDSLYYYEGTDYSTVMREKDVEAFQTMVAEAVAPAATPDVRAALAQLKHARKLEAAARKLERKASKWKESGYVSKQVVLPEISSEHEPPPSSEKESTDMMTDTLKFVHGDVTRPQGTGRKLICHVVDNSGRWPLKGIFRSISDLDVNVAEYYELAGDMNDLDLGSCHIVPNMFNPDLSVALLVAQSRNKRSNVLSDISMSQLEKCLQKVYHVASEMGASVHLSRIVAQSTDPNLWYQFERLLKKTLSTRGIPTIIYYYQRRRERDTANVPPQAASPPPKAKQTIVRKVPRIPLLPLSKQLQNFFPSFLAGCSFTLDGDIPVSVQCLLERRILAYGGTLTREEGDHGLHRRLYRIQMSPASSPNVIVMTVDRFIDWIEEEICAIALQ